MDEGESGSRDSCCIFSPKATSADNLIGERRGVEGVRRVPPSRRRIPMTGGGGRNEEFFPWPSDRGRPLRKRGSPRRATPREPSREIMS